MTANVNDVGLFVEVCFFDVTKPHSSVITRSFEITVFERVVRTRSVVNVIIR